MMVVGDKNGQNSIELEGVNFRLELLKGTKQCYRCGMFLTQEKLQPKKSPPGRTLQGIPSHSSQQLSCEWWRLGKKGGMKERGGEQVGWEVRPLWVDWVFPDARASELQSLSRRCEIASADNIVTILEEAIRCAQGTGIYQ